MKNEKKPNCKSTKKERLAWQKTHKPDFDRTDLWKNLCMDNAGVFCYGFDDEEEAKEYAALMKKRRHPVRIVPLDEALGMPMPPTFEHNWNYDSKLEPPAGMFD